MSNEKTQYPLGSRSATLIEKAKNFYTLNYKPREMILDRGRGAVIYDLDGNDYIDLGSGIAVASLGHSHPKLIKMLNKQSKKLWHTSNVFYTEPPIRLAEKLVELSGFARRVYLCNSGTEANEAAIKLVRKYAADRGRDPSHREIISFAGSFHGRTLAAVTATAQPKYHQGFEPLPPGFVYCGKFNDEAAISALVNDRTCAIFVEPVQGEGGVVPAKPGFLQHLRMLCDRVGALLVVDEIQAGMARTGTMFAHAQDEVTPDLVTLAKALGCGLPIGALLVGEKAAETFQFGSHGSTFGGNPVIAAVALEAITILSTRQINVNVKERNMQIVESMSKINAEFDLFSELRGRGLMVGAELKSPYKGQANTIADMARKEGVLVLIAGPDVLRFLPPLNISRRDLEKGLLRLRNAISKFKRDLKTASV
jgi:acetylornithine/N-succinyldiaminopimelate aminotransferase